MDSGVCDYSDYFQISGGGGVGSPNYIQVTSPNSMSNWTAGSGEPIEWNSSTSDDMDYTVDIELWKSGSYYELIDPDLQSSSSGSSYWWFIPDYLPDGNDYEVRVVHFDSGVDDFSDYFQISGGGGGGPDWIDVTSPVSGSVWFAGSEESISWSSYTPDGSDYEVDIELWRDGNYYQWIVGEYPSNSSADSYQWYIPNNISDGSNYQIRVYHVDSGVGDYSDYFQIRGGGAGGFISGNLHSEESVSGELIVGLFSPNNGGEEWDPDWWQNWYVTFPSDQNYQFDESGISDGYGYEFHEGAHQRVPQIGNVVTEADVDIGSNSTIDRARFGSTIIGAGTKVDNQVQIAHNVRIGKHCLVVAQVGISGSTVLGDGVVLAGQAGVAGHLNIGSGAIVAGGTGVSRSLKPQEKVRGPTAEPIMLYNRVAVLQRRLPDLFKRFGKLEKSVESLAERGTSE